MHLKTAGRIMIAGTLVLALAAQGVSGAVATAGKAVIIAKKNTSRFLLPIWTGSHLMKKNLEKLLRN